MATGFVVICYTAIEHTHTHTHTHKYCLDKKAGVLLLMSDKLEFTARSIKWDQVDFLIKVFK